MFLARRSRCCRVSNRGVCPAQAPIHPLQAHHRPRREHVDSVEIHVKNPRVTRWYLSPVVTTKQLTMIDCFDRSHGGLLPGMIGALARVSQQLDSPGLSPGTHETHEQPKCMHPWRHRRSRSLSRLLSGRRRIASS